MRALQTTASAAVSRFPQSGVGLGWLSLVVLLAALLAGLATSVRAEADPSAEPVSEDVQSPQSKLSGREIYQCVLDNRFQSYVQHSKLVSGDRGEAEQESRLRMTWSSFRGDDGKAVKGVLSKSMVRYLDPFDLRFSGYLIVNNELRENDQWVYLPTYRRIRRVNLRREAVFGTDFTFEDIVPREIEEGDYQRLPDVLQDGTPAYVVQVTPTEGSGSDYSKFVIHVDKTNCVPLLTDYYDDKDLHVKQLVAPAQHVKELDGVHVPMELTMTNIQLETYTTLIVEDLDPNSEVSRKTFDLRRLEAH